MLTTPITTPYFHSRVLTVLSSHLEEVESHPNRTLPVPIISSLSPVDTPLAPGEIVSQLLAVVSPWIDLCSPDPVVYNLSRQVLELEVAYASFCGIGNIILPRPKLHHGKLSGEGVTQYACAVQDVMNIGHYIQMSVSLPMMDNPEEDSDNVIGSLAERARAEYLGLAEGGPYKNSMDELEEDDEGSSFVLPRKKPARVNFFGTWDAWNVIRTVCKYNNRLFVGKNQIEFSLQTILYQMPCEEPSGVMNETEPGTLRAIRARFLEVVPYCVPCKSVCRGYSLMC